MHTHGAHTVVCRSCVSFTLVAVMEDFRTLETDKEEEEQTTQDPDLTTGECPPLHFRVNT